MHSEHFLAESKIKYLIFWTWNRQKNKNKLNFLSYKKSYIKYLHFLLYSRCEYIHLVFQSRHYANIYEEKYSILIRIGSEYECESKLCKSADPDPNWIHKTCVLNQEEGEGGRGVSFIRLRCPHRYGSLLQLHNYFICDSIPVASPQKV